MSQPIAATLFGETIQLTSNDGGMSYTLLSPVVYDLDKIWWKLKNYFGIPGGYAGFFPKKLTLKELEYFPSQLQYHQDLILYFSVKSVRGVFNTIVDFDAETIKISCNTDEINILPSSST